MLPFKTLISIDRDSDVAVYRQICDGFIKMIGAGILQPESALPSSRKLAVLLQINRNTIKLAYEELAGQGWIESVNRRGYYVKDKLPRISGNFMIFTTEKKSVKENFEWTNRFKEIPFVKNLQKIPLAIDDGFPDVRLAPFTEVLRECRSIHKHFYGKNFLKYGNPKGSERLRSSVNNYLFFTRGVRTELENIIITKGSQMGIYIASQLLIEIGDIVAVGNSNYLTADEAFIAAGAKLLRIPVDEAGMDVDYLENMLEHTRIKAVFVIPYHHCPTTVTMSMERRMKLLRLSREYRFAIIEDDYDFDFHYDEDHYLPLASATGGQNVIYIGSISKTFAPAVRIGFMTGPESFINAAVSLRKLIERQGDTLLEEAFATLFESGEMGRHFRKSIKVYKERRDAFCDILNKNFNEYMDFKMPDGGLAVWSEFEKGIDLVKTADNALKRGLYVPDSNFYKNESFSSNSLRMGFASLDETEMEKAFDIFKKSIA